VLLPLTYNARLDSIVSFSLQIAIINTSASCFCLERRRRCRRICKLFQTHRSCLIANEQQSNQSTQHKADIKCRYRAKNCFDNDIVFSASQQRNSHIVGLAAMSHQSDQHQHWLAQCLVHHTQLADRNFLHCLLTPELLSTQLIMMPRTQSTISEHHCRAK